MRFLSILTLIFCMNAHCKSFKKTSGQIYTGQEESDIYYGPYHPFVIKDKENIRFADEDFYGRFFEGQIGFEIFDLYRFYNNQLLKSQKCPEFYFRENADYMRYLFRLITLSYLYESIKKSHYTLYSLDGRTGDCPKNLKDILRKCTAKTQDMKMFAKRARHYFTSREKRQKYHKMDNQSKKRWLETFSFRKDSQIAASRINSWCVKNKIDCSDLSMARALKGLKISCREDVSLALEVCNENDSLFGISDVQKAMDLITSSHSKKMINQGGHGNACLERFSDSFKFKEVKYYQLNNIFTIVSEHLLKNRSAYMQGALYLPGSLKEFDEQGLKDFIYKKNKVVKKVVKKKVVKKVIPKVKPIAMPKPKPIVVKKRPKPKLVVKTKPSVIIKLSYFEKRYKKFLLDQKGKITLDPEKYKKDYIFPKKFVEKMKGPLEIYKTRMAIQDMLTYDKIGSFKNPLQISFIKYLIDFDQHQGLFNIVSIMGNKFFIKNDIESKNDPIFIELRNDETTGYRWQISFLRPVMKEANDSSN